MNSEYNAIEDPNYDLVEPPFRWVCGACVKTSPNCYGCDRDGKNVADSGWDESCMLNAVLCRPATLLEKLYGTPKWVATPSTMDRTRAAKALQDLKGGGLPEEIACKLVSDLEALEGPDMGIVANERFEIAKPVLAQHLKADTVTISAWLMTFNYYTAKSQR